MIFNNKKDVKHEIKSKVFRFYDNNIKLHSCIKELYKDLIPLLNNYLYELKILKEITSFNVKINNIDVIVNLELNMNDITTEYTLNVGLDVYKKEKRINKINNIDSTNIEYLNY
jgi:hypothetical protein